MKIFLSAVEGQADIMDRIIDAGERMHYNLMSYYYIQNKGLATAERIRDHTEEILIDSGAHSFQFGKKVNWDEYTRNYAEFIQYFDRPNVVGYFEMDIENIIGYDKVKDLRRILENVSDKIIPVWHPPRGIQDFKDMCAQYAGKIIAIGGFRGTDIKNDQFIMFLKYAKKHNCKVHCLGMTRKRILDKVPFDYTDSSTWLAQANFGNMFYPSVTSVYAKVKGEEKKKQILNNYRQGMKMQEHYYNKWKSVCKD